MRYYIGLVESEHVLWWCLLYFYLEIIQNVRKLECSYKKYNILLCVDAVYEYQDNIVLYILSDVTAFIGVSADSR